MAAMSQGLLRWRRERPNQLFVLIVAIAVLAGAIWVGGKSRLASSRLAAKKPAWQKVADDLANLRQQFRLPSSRETAALVAESGNVAALGVPFSERVSLMELVARVADDARLSDVHVSFKAGTDSSFVPARAIGASTLNVAPYSIIVDISGSFAGVVQFVSNLPPSVSVSRLSASRQDNRAAYHILLSVYELPDGDNAS
jgi:hypothetical protein